LDQKYCTAVEKEGVKTQWNGINRDINSYGCPEAVLRFGNSERKILMGTWLTITNHSVYGAVITAKTLRELTWFVW